MDESAKPPSHFEEVVEISAQNAAKVKNEALNTMDYLDGWCSKEKASILVDLILKSKPEKVLEIGVYGGKSLVPMAIALKANKKGIIYGIDPWERSASLQGMSNASSEYFWSTVDYESVLQALVSRIEQFDLEDQIKLIRDTSANTPLMYDIDVLHIDGNHSEVTSYLDVTKWGPLVKSGGWIILDDITWIENGAYTEARAVEWLNTHCHKFGQFSDTCDWGVWVKP